MRGWVSFFCERHSRGGCATRLFTNRQQRLRHFGFWSRLLLFEKLQFCLSLAFHGFGSFSVLLLPALDLGIELADLFLKARFSFSAGFAVLCLHLGQVGFHRVGVFF